MTVLRFLLTCPLATPLSVCPPPSPAPPPLPPFPLAPLPGLPSPCPPLTRTPLPLTHSKIGLHCCAHQRSNFNPIYSVQALISK